MKSLVLVTNAHSQKVMSPLIAAAKGIIDLLHTKKMCITQKKDQNLKLLKEKDVVKVIVFDPSCVGKDMAKRYMEDINNHVPNHRPKFVIAGNDYRIEGAENLTCWKAIKGLAA